MSTEVIFSLVLASLFLGAIAWLVIYSRLQHRKAERPDIDALPVARKDEDVKAVRATMSGRRAERAGNETLSG